MWWDVRDLVVTMQTSRKYPHHPQGRGQISMGEEVYQKDISFPEMSMICKKLTTKPTSFPGFSPTCPYRARERERERETDPGWVWSHDSRTKLILREDSFVSQFSGWLIFTVCAMIARNMELLTLLDKLDKQVNNQRRNQKFALSQFHWWNQSLKFYTSMVISWRENPCMLTSSWKFQSIWAGNQPE